MQLFGRLMSKRANDVWISVPKNGETLPFIEYEDGNRVHGTQEELFRHLSALDCALHNGGNLLPMERVDDGIKAMREKAVANG